VSDFQLSIYETKLLPRDIIETRQIIFRKPCALQVCLPIVHSERERSHPLELLQAVTDDTPGSLLEVASKNTTALLGSKNLGK
jgi:hypothetical protein